MDESLSSKAGMVGVRKRRERILESRANWRAEVEPDGDEKMKGMRTSLQLYEHCERDSN